MKVVDLDTKRRRRSEQRVGAPAAPDPLLEALRHHLRGPGDLIPEDAALVRALLGDGLALAEEDVRRRLARLADEGALRRVVIGHERHLALGPPAATAPRDGAQASAGAESDEGFRLRVAIDVETERVLLYRVAIVVSGLVAIVLLRALAVLALCP